MSETVTPAPAGLPLGPAADKSALAFEHAEKLDRNLREFIDEIRKRDPNGRGPWAIVAAPEFLHQIVLLLAYRFSCQGIIRPNTEVSNDDIQAFFQSEGNRVPGGSRFFRLSKPALMAEIYGVPFIACVGVPPGSLAFIPAEAPPAVILCEPTQNDENDGQTAKGVGEANA